MFRRSTAALTFILFGSAGFAGTASAQYYPVRPVQAYPPVYSRPLPPVQVEDDEDLAAPGAPRALYPPIMAPEGPPPGAVYRQPPPGYQPMDPRAAPPPNYGAVDPRLGPPPYGQPAPGAQDAMRPPLSIGPGGYGAQAVPQDDVVGALPPEDRPETGPRKELPTKFRRQMVNYSTKEPAGTIIIDTPHTYLYLVLGNGQAMRYGVGVGREGFTWTGAEKVSRMAEWPDWHPPDEMIERQPYLPRFMAGGEGNPLGARALYLGKTLYRIHGTNQPSTIGTYVSSGCIRLTNDDISDLYTRVKVGTRVVVLPGGAPPATAAVAPPPPVAAAPPPPQREVESSPFPALFPPIMRMR
jgi:lipoprotein-anchoring transpeptidase ErfK/SrfK